ncbi:site-2 protease family protein [Bowmanella dokdonensis]|uniref:M50 family metallopeptidase n=1 Tax=Bowmanella dokdonensis TaxID=751969 RepID=A0A939DLD1_9ALTE|nr:site-2 protease family protein [Bowmanella dokdonensis]MBN7823931.1 M50 family metallopeptidase [Bowmanella dokdonensis]
MIVDQMRAASGYRFDHGVSASIENTQVVLSHGRTGKSVAVTGTARCLLAPLHRGASFEELLAVVNQHYPGAKKVENALHHLLASLLQTGLVVRVTDDKQRKGFIYLCSFDPAARLVACLLSKVHSAVRLFLYAFLISSSCLACYLLFYHQAVPPLSQLVLHVDLFGVWLFVLLVIPVHEFSHAVACRIAGVPAGRFGIVFHAGVLPGPFVDTSASAYLTNRWRKLCIPLAGPITNLLFAGATATLLLSSSYLSLTGFGVTASTLHTFLVLCIAFLYFDTSPLLASDGSHVLEVLFGDDRLRTTACFGQRKAVQSKQAVICYRLCCVVHLLMGVLLIQQWNP